MKTYLIIGIAAMFLVLGIKPLYASEPTVSASLVSEVEDTYGKNFDERVVVLQNYLESKKSPIATEAAHFVESADKYGMDWRLVPAISGVESSFGKRIPYNSYNAYGWNNGDFKFDSWEVSIDHVTKTLRLKYVDRGKTTITKIARTYAPPSTTWGGNVKFFINQIESIPLQFDLSE